MSNIGKYQSKNPLKRALLNRFLSRTRASLPERGVTILDVGTGEGLFWEENDVRSVVGLDNRLDALEIAREGHAVVPVCASADLLPFSNDSFDFVVAIEILEHLPAPHRAVAELSRVARRGGLITVPWEPWFSLMVLVGTGQYGRRLGREPEHIQAFGPKQLNELLSPHFTSVSVTTCLPWLLAEVSFR